MYHLTKGHDAEVFAQTFRQEEAGFNGSGEELRRTPGASPGRARLVEASREAVRARTFGTRQATTEPARSTDS